MDMLNWTTIRLVKCQGSSSKPLHATVLHIIQYNNRYLVEKLKDQTG